MDEQLRRHRRQCRLDIVLTHLLMQATVIGLLLCAPPNVAIFSALLYLVMLWLTIWTLCSVRRDDRERMGSAQNSAHTE